MRSKILAIGSTLLLVAGLFSIGAMSANAHTPTVQASCTTLSVNLTNYNGDQSQHNSVTVTIDGTVVGSNTNFGTTFTQSYTFSDQTVAHTWQVDYTAWDDPSGSHGWTGSQSGTTTPCVAKDASASISFTGPGCDSAQVLVLGPTANASWGDVTYSGTDNRDFSVTATATGNHRFANGDTTKLFTGTLLAAIGGCTPPPCLDNSAVSYSYDATTNSGVITVAPQDGHSTTLCHPFWVVAASWTFDGSTQWPQTLDQWNLATGDNLNPTTKGIDSVGTYNYAADVNCGQGDIYATFDAPGVPYPTAGVLTSSHTPYPEHFLHEMGFTGPNPAYTVQDAAACSVIRTVPAATFTDVCGVANDLVNVPTQDGVVYTTVDSRSGGVGTVTVTAAPAAGHVFASSVTKTTWSFDFTNAAGPTNEPAAPSAVDPTCPVGVKAGASGYIQLGLKDHLHYAIDGVPTTQARNELAPGTYTVSVTVDSGFTLSGPSSWEMTINPAFCPPTLALLSTTASMQNIGCSAAGSFTLANTEGIKWLVNGVLTPAGTYKVTDASTVNVEAQLVDDVNDGWEDGAQQAWTFDFTDPADCLPTLAFTGTSGTDLGLLLAGGLLLLGGVVVASERRLRTTRR
jgi:hypothetical protein